jgi:hypothetical protein
MRRNILSAVSVSADPIDKTILKKGTDPVPETLLFVSYSYLLLSLIVKHLTADIVT